MVMSGDVAPIYGIAFESRFWWPGEGAGQHALLEGRFRVPSDLLPKDIPMIDSQAEKMKIAALGPPTGKGTRNVLSRGIKSRFKVPIIDVLVQVLWPCTEAKQT